MAHNVCVSSVVRFRSRVLSPTPNVERRYKLWATPHRTIEETFCCALGRVNRYLNHDLSQVVRYFSLTSPSPLLAKRWVVFSFAFFKSSDVICRGARKLWSDHALSAGNNCRPKVILIFSSPFACRHTSLQSQTLCCLPRPVYGDASRAWCTTFVFAQWWAFEAASCPRHKALNEDNTYSLHVTPTIAQTFCWRLLFY